MKNSVESEEHMIICHLDLRHLLIFLELLSAKPVDTAEDQLSEI